MEKIRNFSIVAHIDHGKSTLSDRILEFTKTVEKRDMSAQVLDSLEIEKEKGITIKSAAVTVKYKAKDNTEYIFNLIDTPGHVDFSYEVSRSLAACEGAILIVDATQGIEAQTIANFYLAFEADLTILPVINKIDLPAAEPEAVKNQIEKEFALDKEDVVLASAKEGIGIGDLLEKIIEVIPAPKGDENNQLKALLFDAYFDKFRGAIIHIRVVEGTLKEHDKVKFYFNESVYNVEELGIIGVDKKNRQKKKELSVGEVGYVILGIKSVSEVKIGDTLTHLENSCQEPLPGYKEVKPMVFAGIFPTVSEDYNDLRNVMGKLQLNDSSLQYEKDSSLALGFGFRCGFLGLLHMEIVQERLIREFDMSVIVTAPSVRYHVEKTDGSKIMIENPAEFPPPTEIALIKEPFIKATIITPTEFLGNIMGLIQAKRGIQKRLNHIDEKRIEGVFELPLSEIIFDFYDKLKSLTKGYASFDYEMIDYRETIVSKVQILVNKEPVDAFSFLCYQDFARERSKVILEKLKKEIPRHMFAIALQAAIGNNIIARENISALRKDVTSKCYGGDISRKRKLLEKQKEGKRKMKSIGSIDIPQKAFINILKN